MPAGRQIQTRHAPEAIGPYSQAIDCGALVFVSGQIPLDAVTGEIVGTDTATQTRQVLRNVAAVLGAAGLSLADVVKATVYLQDLSEFTAMNAVYAEVFPVPAPARSTVEVSRLPRDVRIEIDVIAAR